jgi:hypothetical protein
MQLSGQNNGVLKCITGVVMMQMTAKAGIKKHGQVAIDALFEEFSQLHDLGVFLGQDRNKLTTSEKRRGGPASHQCDQRETMWSHQGPNGG